MDSFEFWLFLGIIAARHLFYEWGTTAVMTRSDHPASRMEIWLVCNKMAEVATYIGLELLHLDGVLHELPLLVDLSPPQEDERVLRQLALQVDLVLGARGEQGLRHAVCRKKKSRMKPRWFDV